IVFNPLDSLVLQLYHTASFNHYTLSLHDALPIYPAEFTNKNIETYKRQINQLGFSYDWDREINTTDPKYYKWTQWIFTKLKKDRSEEHTSELQSRFDLVCRLLLEKKKQKNV